MTEAEYETTEHEESLAPSCYFDQATLAELRRYVCLDMARLGGAMPDKMIRLARDMERFLMGRALHTAEDQN
jgi:hypothetical protein